VENTGVLERKLFEEHFTYIEVRMLVSVCQCTFPCISKWYDRLWRCWWRCCSFFTFIDFLVTNHLHHHLIDAILEMFFSLFYFILVRPLVMNPIGAI